MRTTTFRPARPSATTQAVLTALSLLALPAAHANSSNTSNPADNDSTAMTLGQIVVTGQASANARRDPSTVTILPTERIQDQTVSHAWELFEHLPNVMLTRFGQGTTSGKLSIRGFNGEGEINAVKLLIDGIPSNSNDGNMPYIDLLPRLAIDQIELVRGTNDPRYGLHAIAGHTNLVSRQGGQGLAVRAGLGSFNSQDLQASAAFEHQGWTQNYAVGYQRSDGYRDHAASNGLTASGQWFYTLPASTGVGKTRIGLIVRALQADAQEAGYLTQAQAQANPRQSAAHNASDEDRRRASQIALKLDTALSPGLTLATHLYRNELDDRRYVRFSAGVSQQERYVAETHTGAAINLQWQLTSTPLGAVTLSGGLDTERQDNRSDRYNTVMQVRSSQTRAQQFDLNLTGAYLQASLQPLPGLTITPAYRVDSVAGDYINQLNGRRYDINDYGLIRQPKLGLSYALSPQALLYGNWGKTFQIGVGTAAYKVNQTSDLAPSINTGWEVGLRVRPTRWLSGRIAVWEQTASNEARRKLNDPANDAENIGSTRRQGIDLELNARANDQWTVWMALSSQRSKILQTDAASAATQGREIDHVPHWLASLGADYQPSQALRLSVSAQGQGSYFLERSNSTGRFGGFVLWNASASYQLSPKLQLALNLRNLTDRDYAYVWWDGAQSLHAPGAGRSAMATIKLSY